MRRLETGNPQIDSILAGGFPTNSINIVMGQPGTGKTLFAAQLAFANANADRPVLYLTTLSEPLSKVITYLQEAAFADPELIGGAVVYEDLTEEVSHAPETLPELIRDRLQQHRPRLLIIDSFKALAELTPERPQWRRVLADLAGLLSAYSVTTLWLGEYTAEDITREPEFAVADGILELTREQRGTRDDRYLRVVKLRGSGFLDGQHAFRIGASGLEVFPRLRTPDLAADYETSAERLSSGIPGLDRMIETGWLRGTSTLVTGPSGSGKTVLGLQFLRKGVEEGEPGLLVTFEENPIQLARMVRNFGWSPQELLLPGKLEVLYTSPVELQIDTIIHQLFERIERSGVRRVVVDGLAELESGARDPIRFRDYLYAMSQRFSSLDVTCLLTLEGQYGSPGTSPQSRVLSPLSDNILRLEMSEEEEMTRAIRMVKSRGSRHDSRRRVLRITSSGMEVE
jgi:circadian clock protein KaiC